jgi:tripeptide aminopeptidase
LLGADDKAGICEIVSAMEYLIQNPQIKHGEIKVGFTPDEEIGRGAHKFDVKAFNADWAYTMDGSQIGELEYENFNAASAVVKVNGKIVHPGYAKGKMINSMLLAQEFICGLPNNETPEKTEDYEGFFHLHHQHGSVETTTLEYIIRDHDKTLFEGRKQLMLDLVITLNKKFGEDTFSIVIKDQYYNMKEKVEPVMHIVEIAEKAMVSLGIKPLIKPIRGGTDGSQLSYMGLPCPNIFAGGHNFHGRYEYVPVESMIKATEVICKICELTAK